MALPALLIIGSFFERKSHSLKKLNGLDDGLKTNSDLKKKSIKNNVGVRS